MASIDYLNRLRDLKKPEYTSQYGGVISGLMDTIVNRQPFSYDFNADPLFHQYKDQYVKLGKEAAMNAVANASALTGGYGNSYAVTAGAQANQQALSGLNNIIPQLLNSAQKKFDSDTNALLTQYDIYNQAEQDNYNKFRDQMADYNNERAYLTGMYNDALAQENYAAEQAEEQRRYEANLALQMAKNASKKTNEPKANKNGNVAAILGAVGNVVKGVGDSVASPLALGVKTGANAVTGAAKDTMNKINNAGYRDYALTQKAIQVYNGTKDINQVEKLLEGQVKQGVLSENEAIDLLDDIIKNLR